MKNTLIFIVVLIITALLLVFVNSLKAEEVYLFDTELLDTCFSNEGTMIELKSGAKVTQKNDCIIAVGKTDEEVLKEQEQELRLHELKIEIIRAGLLKGDK